MANHSATRRTFIKTSATLAAASTLGVAAQAHVGGDDMLKVGLIGCGGRGTGAARQALRADRNVKLWAMGDAFEDRLTQSLNTLQRDADLARKIDCPPARHFVGFDAYRRVIECCDVVLLCTPPGFRPEHLRAAIAADRHVFAEKPVAVDAPGVRSVLDTCREAQRKNLNVVSGLCLRHDNSFKEAVRRIRDGAIGDPMALQANDYRGGIWVRRREAGWSDMTWQMRNWYYFAWLSGDFNVEQHVHFLDVCAWVLGDRYPARCYALGGRQVRTGPEYGHIYDHFSTVYEYEGGVKVFSNCRQQPGCVNDMSAHVMGTRGTGLLSERRRGVTLKTGEREWVYDGPANDMYQTEHDVLFAAIRSGRPINNGEYMTKSTLMAIMARVAAYTGQAVTWDQAMNSRENLMPPRLAWDVELPVPAVARPGITRLE